MSKKISLNEQIEIWAKEREANPIPCKKCGSVECEPYTERGLSGMTSYWVYPCELRNRDEE